MNIRGTKSMIMAVQTPLKAAVGPQLRGDIWLRIPWADAVQAQRSLLHGDYFFFSAINEGLTVP